MKAKIFIIDDDEKLGRRLKKYLNKFDYSVRAFTNPTIGLEEVETNPPDLIILDVMMPEMDGFEVLRNLRESNNIPVIMLTARGSVTDKVVGLELGADDYLAKPFEPRELVARIQTILRRTESKSAKSEKALVEIDNFSINFNNHKVSINGKNIVLTALEFELLKIFIEKNGQVLSRDFLMDTLKDVSWKTFDRSIDVLISRLRKKLNDNPKDPEYIKTVRGSGYIFIKGE